MPLVKFCLSLYTSTWHGTIFINQTFHLFGREERTKILDTAFDRASHEDSDSGQVACTVWDVGRASARVIDHMEGADKVKCGWDWTLDRFWGISIVIPVPSLGP